MSDPSGKPLLTSAAAQLDPAHTALLVIDVQNDFCADGGYIDKLLGRDMSQCQGVVGPIQTLIDAARDSGVPVFWINANYASEHLAVPVLAKQKAGGVTMECCVPGTWGADYFGGLKPEADDIVIEKHRYNAFSGTPLDNLLRARGIKTLVLTGVQTNVCVDSTLRDGFSRGYYIVIPEDGVGSHTPELHQATLANVRMLFGTVCESDDITQQWHSQTGATAHQGKGEHANAAG